MSKKPARPPDDEQTRRLRAAVRKRRVVTLPGLVVLLLMFVLPAGLFLWWFWPTPPPPRLGVIAYDQLALPGETVPLVAQVWPEGGAWNRTSPQGWELDFHSSVGPAGKSPSGPGGLGHVSITAPKEEKREKIGTRLLATRNQRGAVDEAAVFVWPADSPLWIVDVQGAMTSADPADWQKKNLVDIPPLPGMIETLHRAKVRVVYLATFPEDGLGRRKVRAWVEHHGVTKPGLPAGPVLSLPLSGEPLAEMPARKHILRDLASRFPGPLTAILGKAEDAALAKSLGMNVIYFSSEEGPPGLARAGSWEEVEPLLKGKLK